MTSYSWLAIDRPLPGVSRLTLDRPPVNALGAELRRELISAAASLADDRTLCCVLLAARGKAFCAGADLKERQGMSQAQVIDAVQGNRAVVQAIAEIPVPTIAVIHAAALGGGFELALGCDLRIAAAGAPIGLPECSLAIIPGAHGTQRLPRVVGSAVARKWIFTARVGTAEEARTDGLIDEVTAADALESTAMTWAGQIARCGPLALRAAKRALDSSAAGLAEGLAAEWQCYLEILPSEDRLEALAAFAAKRAPVFRGR
ncbi:MAG: enoyl-CoA hydratase-related protein [Acidobacteriota bacterium]